MTSPIVDIRHHAFSPDDLLFLDTNVWVYVYGPTGPRDSTAGTYSRALRNMRQGRSQVFLDALVLAEFIGVFIHLEYDRLMKAGLAMGYRDFAQTKEFRAVAQDAAINATQILHASRPCGSCFEMADIGSLLARFAKGPAGFTDLMLVEICKAGKFTLGSVR